MSLLSPFSGFCQFIHWYNRPRPRLMSDYTSAADRGKGLGLLESAISLGGGLGPLAGSLIADAAQLQAVIVFSLAIALISVASSQILLKEKPTVAIPDPTLSGM